MDVPIGVSVGEMIEKAGGLDKPDEVGEIIMGGAFTGRAAELDEPITKTTGGILTTYRMPDLTGKKVGLLVCACGGNEARMRVIAEKMHGEVVSVCRCKQAIENAKAQVQALLRRSFRPEFLNRLDEIVFYKPLTKENVTKIIDLQIDKLNQRLADQQIKVELTQAAKDAIVDASYDPQYGARPLRRYVQHTVETMLSKRLLRGDILPGQTITVDAVDGQLEIR